MPEPNLTSLQQNLWRLITAPDGVAKALKTHPQELPLRGNAELGAVARLDIYADMYFYRIRDALKEDFPLLHKMLGEACFHNLITDYLVSHPPTHFSLRYAGQNLPDFLRHHGFSRERPWLPNLARYEWLLLESFDAADTTTDASILARLSPEEWDQLHFEFAPSFFMARFSFPILEIAEAVRRKKTTAPAPRECFVRIWRKDFKVYSREISQAESETAARLLRNESFGAACAALAALHGEYQASREIAVFLQTWLNENCLSTIRKETTSS